MPVIDQVRDLQGSMVFMHPDTYRGLSAEERALLDQHMVIQTSTFVEVGQITFIRVPPTSTPSTPSTTTPVTFTTTPTESLFERLLPLVQPVPYSDLCLNKDDAPVFDLWDYLTSDW